MAEHAIEIAKDLVDRANKAGAIRLVCSTCADGGVPVPARSAAAINATAVARLIDHVTTAHGRYVSTIRTELRVEAISGRTLAARLGLPPATDREQAWRDDPREKVADILQRMVDETRRHNSVLAGLSAELSALGYEVPKVERCPKCGHAPHEGGFCLNMASDNDCDCDRRGEDARP